MTVTDEAKLFTIRQQLLEMRFKLDASINIINYVFDRPAVSDEAVPRLDVPNDFNSCRDVIEFGGQDSATGLHPGQLPDDLQFVEEETEIECEA